MKFYGQVQSGEECTFDAITRTAADRSTVTSADAKAVMDNVMNIAIERLKSGNIIRINDLGSFRLSISTEGTDTKEEFNQSKIKKARIIYTPCKDLKTFLKTLEFKKTNTYALKGEPVVPDKPGGGSGTGGTDGNQGENPLG